MAIKFRRPSVSRFFHHVITAHEPKCGLCFLNVTRYSPTERVEHFQGCWDELHAKIPLEDFLSWKGLKRADYGDDDLKSYRDVELEEEECETTAEDEYDEKHTERIEKGDGAVHLQCLLCSTNLTQTSGIDAFTHLQRCIPITQPLDCPLCTDDHHSFDLHPYDCRAVLAHLYTDHILTLDETTPDDAKEDLFTKALCAWSARQEIFRLSIFDHGKGQRTTWGTYEHRDSYAKKKERGNVGSKLWLVENAESDDVPVPQLSGLPSARSPALSRTVVGNRRKRARYDRSGRFQRYVVALPSLYEDEGLDEEIESSATRADSCAEEEEDEKGEQQVEEDDVHGENVQAPQRSVLSSPPGFSTPTTSMEELDAILSLQEETLMLE